MWVIGQVKSHVHFWGQAKSFSFCMYVKYLHFRKLDKCVPMCIFLFMTVVWVHRRYMEMTTSAAPGLPGGYNFLTRRSVYPGVYSLSCLMWCNVPHKNLTAIKVGTDSLHFLKIISVFRHLVFSSMPVHIDISFSWSSHDHRVCLPQITKASDHAVGFG